MWKVFCAGGRIVPGSSGQQVGEGLDVDRRVGHAQGGSIFWRGDEYPAIGGDDQPFKIPVPQVFKQPAQGGDDFLALEGAPGQWKDRFATQCRPGPVPNGCRMVGGKPTPDRPRAAPFCTQ